MNELQKLVSDEEIKKVFTNTNFGNTPHREVISDTLLKLASGYSSGRFAHCCVVELGLCKFDKRQKCTLTPKGKEYLYEAFKDKI